VKNEQDVYNNEYIPYIVRWGRLTNLIGVLLALLPGLVLLLFYNIKPPISAVFAGFVMQASVSGVFWFSEPISYFPVLGVPGTYMSFLSGNIGNLRLPASAAALTAAQVEPGTPQASIIATIGIAISIVVNVLFLTITVVLGATVLSLLPPFVVAALNNILPALFGAMFAQQVVNNPKMGLLAGVLTAVMLVINKMGWLKWLPGGGTYVIVLVAVFGSILIGRTLFAKDLTEKSE
jgi:hypothetical protein